MEQLSPISELQKQAELLRMELRYEQESYAHSMAQNRMTSRVQEATCRYPVTLGDFVYNALDQMVVSVSYETDEDDPGTEFEPGKPISFFYQSEDGTELHEVPHQYYIEQAGEGVVTVAIPNRQAMQSLRSSAQIRLLGIQTAIDTTSYQVMLEALDAAMRSENEKFVHLRDTLIGPLQPRFRHLPPLSFPWLNRRQQEAVQKVVEAQEVAIVHGPPGTGKTTTLVEAIIETLRRETQVMVCAPSNAAVDWISEQLMRRGVNVLRVGNPLRMSDAMLECSYERRFAAHPDYAELWNIRRTLRQERGPGLTQQQKARLAKLDARATELGIRIHTDLFDQARVISCTLIGSAYHILEHRRFSTLFIDEAAQGLQAACWAAILKADRVVLSGDHMQLPPTIKCPEAAHGGLDRTLMQIVAQTKKQCVTLLTTQYRMNNDIMAFPSQWFYHGLLKAAPQVAARLVSPIDTALTWIDTSQCLFGERQSRSLSRSNAEEARLLIHVLRDYVEMVGPTRLQNDRTDFGIISPYRAQVRLIRRLLKWQKYFRTLRSQISVGTVDGFQGQERDVIVISMVRDNDQGSIGFLNDLRRMNVAITRAKMKLIIVGNAETLSRHRFYAQLIEHFRTHGDFVTLPPPTTDTTEEST